MVKDLKQHKHHYLALTGALGLHLLAFVMLSYNDSWQQLILLSACGAYFLWGVLHHYANHDLENHIVLEYALFAVLCYVLGSMMI